MNRETDFFTVKVWNTIDGYYRVQRTMVPISALPDIIANLNVEEVLVIRSDELSQSARKATKK